MPSASRVSSDLIMLVSCLQSSILPTPRGEGPHLSVRSDRSARPWSSSTPLPSHSPSEPWEPGQVPLLFPPVPFFLNSLLASWLTPQLCRHVCGAILDLPVFAGPQLPTSCSHPKVPTGTFVMTRHLCHCDCLSRGCASLPCSGWIYCCQHLPGLVPGERSVVGQCAEATRWPHARSPHWPRTCT